MKYRVEKVDGLWYGYGWHEGRNCWFYINSSVSLTKLGCKYYINKYHKKRKSDIKTKSEEFELE